MAKLGDKSRWKELNLWMIGVNDNPLWADILEYAPDSADLFTSPEYNEFKPLDGDNRYIFSGYDFTEKEISWTYVLPSILDQVFDLLQEGERYYLWTGHIGQRLEILIKTIDYKTTRPSLRFVYSFSSERNEHILKKELIHTGTVKFVICDSVT